MRARGRRRGEGTEEKRVILSERAGLGWGQAPASFKVDLRLGGDDGHSPAVGPECGFASSLLLGRRARQNNRAGAAELARWDGDDFLAHGALAD
jgi:hypothetical protein